MTLRDAEYDPDSDYEYECLGCSETLHAATHPGECPECGTAMRNRGMPYE